MNRKGLTAGLVLVVLGAFAAQGGPEAILEQVLTVYLGDRLKGGLEIIKALDVKLGKPKVELKKGSLVAQIPGTYQLAGKRYKASYASTWRDKSNCAFVSKIKFKTDLNPTASDLAQQALRSRYENKCESDEKLATAIRAAWLVKALQ